MTALTAWPDAARADVGDRLAHRREDRPGALDRRGRRRRRRSSAWPSARPRCRPTPARRRGRRRPRRGASAKSRVADGEIVEQSMTSWPARAPCRRAPSGPEQDGLDVGRVRDADDDDVGRGRRRRRASRPRSTPSSSSSGARSGLRFQAVTANPARARLAAIAAPIVPRPRKPIRSPLINRSRCCYARPHHATRPPADVAGLPIAAQGGSDAVRRPGRRARSPPPSTSSFFVLESVTVQPAERRGPVRADDAGADRGRPADGLQPGLLQPVPGARGRRPGSRSSRGGSVDAGRAIVLFACACMVGAGAVLLSTNRRFARSAAIQAVPPLVAIVAALLLR